MPDGERRELIRAAVRLPEDTPVRHAAAIPVRISSPDTRPFALCSAAGHPDDLPGALRQTVGGWGDRGVVPARTGTGAVPGACGSRSPIRAAGRRPPAPAARDRITPPGYPHLSPAGDLRRLNPGPPVHDGHVRSPAVPLRRPRVAVPRPGRAFSDTVRAVTVTGGGSHGPPPGRPSGRRPGTTAVPRRRGPLGRRSTNRPRSGAAATDRSAGCTSNSPAEGQW